MHDDKIHVQRLLFLSRAEALESRTYTIREELDSNSNSLLKPIPVTICESSKDLQSTENHISKTGYSVL